jgi:hypothetical protein
MDQSVLPYCVIYDMDQSIPNFIFKKSIAMGIITVAMSVDSVDNSYVADVTMPIVTTLLFKCGQAPKP